MSEKPIKISELTDYIKQILEEHFFSVYVVGEISNYKFHSSGHHYFSLKDDKSQISCVIWRNTPVRLKLEDGMKVIVRGTLTVYPPQGKYQIECLEVVPEGRGELYIAFEKLKEKLELNGYFDISRKRKIPTLPMKIGVATSPTGAAVQDIISTIQRRFPLAEIYFRPTLVQGESASNDIVKAIEQLNQYDLDIIIIGRGGGSIEDLWCFNMEIVANAIYNSKIPIISAVGHETDFTISDFVADLRAATPTAAAELVTPLTVFDLKNSLANLKSQMTFTISATINSYQKDLENILASNFKRTIEQRIKIFEQKLDDSENQFTFLMDSKIKNFANKIEHYWLTLENLHPEKPFDKGFVLLQQNGKYLKPNQIPKLDKELNVIRKNDVIKTKVITIINKILN
jgi:exodeoxyribonuclease VII large subunit